MIKALVRTAGQYLKDLNRSWLRDRHLDSHRRQPISPRARLYRPLQRVILTDEVGRTLFEEYAAHRKGPRGHEETGWILLGLREESEAIVLATLPAGADREAGIAHVLFNPVGQALASRIVRQVDRRLAMLGVVHTHPGSLRHPSDGDYHGDSRWVSRLRGREGIFGIGTADGDPEVVGNPVYARQVKRHVQTMGALCLSWYALGEGDAAYRPLAADITLGPDLARPLHPLWPTIEQHAERLERLYSQQSGVRFEVVAGPEPAALALNIPLAEPGQWIRVLLEGKQVRYYLVRGDDILAVDCQDAAVDRGVYLLMAELAAQM
jgi:hypothetical protein